MIMLTLLPFGKHVFYICKFYLREQFSFYETSPIKAQNVRSDSVKYVVKYKYQAIFDIQTERC